MGDLVLLDVVLDVQPGLETLCPAFVPQGVVHYTLYACCVCRATLGRMSQCTAILREVRFCRFCSANVYVRSR